MEIQYNMVKTMNRLLYARGLITNRKCGFTYVSHQNASEILHQKFDSILYESDDVLAQHMFSTDSNLDEVVVHLHKTNQKKCVLFVTDVHILKAGEIADPITFEDYGLDGLPTQILVYPFHEMEQLYAKGPSLTDPFIVRRRGLYMFDDEPAILFERALTLHLGIQVKPFENVNIRRPRA